MENSKKKQKSIQRKKLERYLMNWFEKNYLELEYEVKKLNNELDHQKELYKECNFERLRYRDIAIEKKKIIAQKNQEINQLRQQIALMKKKGYRIQR